MKLLAWWTLIVVFSCFSLNVFDKQRSKSYKIWDGIGWIPILIFALAYIIKY